MTGESWYVLNGLLLDYNWNGHTNNLGYLFLPLLSMLATFFHRCFSPSCIQIWKVTTSTQSNCATNWTHGSFQRLACMDSWPFSFWWMATGLCFCWTCLFWRSMSTSLSTRTTCWMPLRSSEPCRSTRRKVSSSWVSTCWCSSSTCTEWSWLWLEMSKRRYRSHIVTRATTTRVNFEQSVSRTT